MDIAGRIEIGALIKLGGLVAVAPALAETAGVVESDEPISKMSPGELVQAPVDPGDLAITGANYVAAPYLMSKVMGPSLTLGQAAASGLGPAFLPASGIFNVLNLVSGPLRDPKYIRGQQGYLSSLPSAMESQVDAMREAGREAARKYGILGLPLQAFHGILNPVTSLGLGVSSVGRALLGKSGELEMEAEDSISEALR